jgi:hypothetical protein
MAASILGPLVWAAHQWMLRRERRAKVAAMTGTVGVAAEEADNEPGGLR